MARIHVLTALAGVCALGAAAHAQNMLINGDFETGQLAPWTLTPTLFGGAFNPALVAWDIDGTGPRIPSLAARLMVGQTTSGVGQQGVDLTQRVALRDGVTYEVRVEWSVLALVNVSNTTGGRFAIIVDGEELTSGEAPATQVNQRSDGRVAARFASSDSRTHTIGVRITRDAGMGEEVFQHVDNVRMRPACPGDVTESGGVGFDDLNAVLTEYGKSGAPGGLTGDADFDGDVDFADLNAVLIRFGRSC